MSIKVIRKKNEDIERFIKRFKKKVMKASILKQYRKGMTFEKSSLTKHKKQRDLLHKRKIKKRKKRKK